MARSQTQNPCDARSSSALNEALAFGVLQQAVAYGVREFCVCPGARAFPLFHALQRESKLKKYFWPEERSAAYFAMGRSRQSGKPVAIVTTSGTAAAELLPATMEAHYLGIPLILVTSDRPRRFRQTGAPQTAEQVGLFGPYAHFSQDLAGNDLCDLSAWTMRGPAHLNVCFEEPLNQTFASMPFLDLSMQKFSLKNSPSWDREMAQLDHFLHQVHHPFAVVSGLKLDSQESVVQFLLKAHIPVLLEGVSGLREDPRLDHLRITRTDRIWEYADKANYPIDGILRIGNVPTFRLWRDLEDKPEMPVCSISEVPFSGLSDRGVICVPIGEFLDLYPVPKQFSLSLFEEWKEADRIFRKKVLNLYEEEPLAEPSLIYHLSKQIPKKARIFLGNSLPIREWDLGACDENRDFIVRASRGVNGIDGQISTFLGLCEPGEDHWAVLGDLTALYDMIGPWILSQMEPCRVTIVVVNNFGGQIFNRMFADPQFRNPHQLQFAPLAEMWNLKYEKWTRVPSDPQHSSEQRLIELIPDSEATARFWKKCEG